MAGPFAIHPSHYGGGYHVLIHLPSQTKIMNARLQMTAREAAEKFAACDVNWWTCIREEIIGPDSQELVNIYGRYHELSSLAPSRDWRKTPEHRK